MISLLEPQIELLTKEYILVQAWKKTASYMRAHNWYSDALALDRATINLPVFLLDPFGMLYRLMLLEICCRFINYTIGIPRVKEIQ
jgi:hypothetical protein